MITEIFRSYVKSYKDLPLNLYHIQWKFRDEVRPRFGVMRGREFLMKDAYSFDLDDEAARAAYNRCSSPICAPSRGMGLKAIPMRADTGPIGGDLSHEFIILADTGESQVFCHKDFLDLPVPASTSTSTTTPRCRIVKQWTSPYAATDEMHDRGGFGQVPERTRFRRAASRSATSSTSATKVFRSRWAPRSPARTARSTPVSMGSYGIGPTRLIAAIIEASHDEAGIIWPEASRPSTSA
jgi:prolyl-tRNA synthetase